MRQLFRIAVGLSALVVGLLSFPASLRRASGSPPKGISTPPKGYQPPNGHQPPPNWGKPPPNHCGCKPPPYPPPPINTSSSYVRQVYVGSSTSRDQCEFDQGSNITITLNGAEYGTATAPHRGPSSRPWRRVPARRLPQRGTRGSRPPTARTTRSWPAARTRRAAQTRSQRS